MKIPRDIIVFFHFGWTSTITMSVFCLGGKYLDEKWNTFPIVFLLMSAFGVLATIGLFVSSIKKMNLKKKPPK